VDSLRLEVKALQVKNRGCEERLGECTAQLKALQQRNLPRELSSQERKQCLALVQAFIEARSGQDPLTDWVYQLERAAIEECCLQLRTHALLAGDALSSARDANARPDAFFRSLESQESGFSSCSDFNYDAQSQAVRGQRASIGRMRSRSPTQQHPASEAPSEGEHSRALTAESYGLISDIATGTESLAVLQPDYYHRLLTRGAMFLKHGRQGKGHARFVYVSPDLREIMWRRFGESEVRNTVPVAAFFAVTEAKGSDVGEAGERTYALTLQGHEKYLCLELDGNRSVEMRDEWIRAFRYAIDLNRRFGAADGAARSDCASSDHRSPPHRHPVAPDQGSSSSGSPARSWADNSPFTSPARQQELRMRRGSYASKELRRPNQATPVGHVSNLKPAPPKKSRPPR
jgi:hypothetical protein